MKKAKRAKSTTLTSQAFGDKLEYFRRDIEAAAQFFYAYVAVHAVAADHKPAYKLLNSAPLFWNTNLGALQTAAFIALHRVFDHSTPFTLLVLAEQNRHLFSREELRLRRQGDESIPPQWLIDYVATAYEPTAEDFRRLKVSAKRWCEIYDERYRQIRNVVFAHTVEAQIPNIDAMMAKTKVREMERMLTFLMHLNEALWQLFNNGRRPVLARSACSVDQMLSQPKSHRACTVQQRVVMEAKLFLRTAQPR